MRFHIVVALAVLACPACRNRVQTSPVTPPAPPPASDKAQGKAIRIAPNPVYLPPGTYRIWLSPGLATRDKNGDPAIVAESWVTSRIVGAGDRYTDVELRDDGPGNLMYFPPVNSVDSYTVFVEVRPGARPLSQRRLENVSGIGRALPVTAMADRSRTSPQHRTFYIAPLAKLQP